MHSDSEARRKHTLMKIERAAENIADQMTIVVNRTKHAVDKASWICVDELSEIIRLCEEVKRSIEERDKAAAELKANSDNQPPTCYLCLDEKGMRIEFGDIVLDSNED